MNLAKRLVSDYIYMGHTGLKSLSKDEERKLYGLIILKLPEQNKYEFLCEQDLITTAFVEYALCKENEKNEKKQNIVESMLESCRNMFFSIIENLFNEVIDENKLFCE